MKENVMSWVDRLGQFLRRLRRLFARRAQLDLEIEEEMRLHRELRAHQLEEDGIARADAHYAAQRRFGNQLRLREEIQDAWGWTWLDHLIQDISYAARRLLHSPGFLTVAILTLALGIGANTAIFTLVNAILLKSLPVSNPDELWSLGDDRAGGGGGGFTDDVSAYSYQGYQYLRDHTPEFSDLAAFQSGETDLSVRRSGDQRPAEHYYGKLVSGNYFRMLGIGVFAGRAMTPADDQATSPPVAIMSYRTWRDHFSSDRSWIGGTLTFRGIPVTVIGIAPPSFFGETLRINPPDFWMPLSTEPILNREASVLNKWNQFWLFAIGRLRGGAQPSQVQAHVTTELQQWLENNYSDPRYTRNIYKQHIVVTPAGRGVAWMRERYRSGLQLLMVASGLVLMIACANLANLLLARGTASRVETAVRVALGATPARILQQTLTEGVILALFGGVAGLWVALLATRGILMTAFRGADYVPLDIGPSLPVLGFTFALSFVTGIIFSGVPAWMASRVQPADPLRGAGRSTGDGSLVPQKSLVVLQAALSLVLLVGAGLLAQSLRNLERQQFGFETQGRWVVSLNPPTEYPLERLEKLYRQFEQRLREIPGVQSVSLSIYSPLDGNGWAEPVSIHGREVIQRLPHGKWPWQNRVSAHYFETLGIRVVRGRTLGEDDTPRSRRVAVISEAFARTFFPNQDPLGKHFGVEEPSHSGDYEIVGVVEDAKYDFARDHFDPMFYLPLLQEEGKYEDTAQAAEQLRTHYIGSIQLRVAGWPEGFDQVARRTMADVDPNLTITAIRSFGDQVSLAFISEQLIARLASLYGGLALVLASVGLYGVTAYLVARRSNEIGIRMALGADRARVVILVVRGAMSLILLGLMIGLPAALMAGRLIASQLFGVSSYNPVILGMATALLLLSAFMAASFPARRAATIDPIQALRIE